MARSKKAWTLTGRSMRRAQCGDDIGPGLRHLRRIETHQAIERRHEARIDGPGEGAQLVGENIGRERSIAAAARAQAFADDGVSAREADAHARWKADAQAPAQQGTQAPVDVVGMAR